MYICHVLIFSCRKIFSENASTGKELLPSVVDNLAVLSRAKLCLNAFRSAISLCRQMHCISKVGIIFLCMQYENFLILI